jgi:hypothetical protein
MDVDCSADVIEDLVEGAEASMVPPAVDVGRLNIKGFFAESFSDELGHTGLACTARTSHNSGIGGLTAGDRLEDTGEVIDLGITMLDFLGNEPSTEDASITNYVLQD